MLLNSVNYSASRLSERGEAFLKSLESLRLHSYLDSAGIWTIGWGTTHYENGKAVSGSDAPITEERAQQLFSFEANAKSYVLVQSLHKNNVILNQNQFDACLILSYNIGIEEFLTSTLYRLIKKNPFDPRIPDAFMLFDKITDPHTKKHKVSRGLVIRRGKESKLYLS